MADLNIFLGVMWAGVAATWAITRNDAPWWLVSMLALLFAMHAFTASKRRPETTTTPVPDLGRAEPSAELREAAASVAQMHVALRQQGFTEDQASTFIAEMIRGQGGSRA